MHRDALAALGESLRREFQDLLHNNEAALADLVEEAQQLLASLDSQMQALAAWLSSSSVAAALSSAASPPGEDVTVGQQTSLPPDSWRALPVTVAHRSTAESGAQSLLDASLKAVERRGDLPFARQTSGAHNVRGTTVYPRAPSAMRAVPTVPPVADVVAPKRGTAVPPDIPPLTVSSTRGESKAPQMIEAHGEQVDKADVLMDTPEYAAVPGKVLLPELSVPSPTAIDPFAPVKNLHDLTRFLAIGDGAAASSAATAASGNGAAAAGSPASGEARAVVLTDARRFATFSVQEGASLPVAQEARPVQPPAAGPGNSLQQGMLREDNPTGAWVVIPPQAAGPEVDQESLLDALSRQVAEEYRRFYGSA